jgi:WD40 repeat protein
MSIHKQVTALLPAYVQGKVTLSETKLIERHLSDCQECQVTLRDWQQIGQNVQKYFTAYQSQIQLPPLSIFEKEAGSTSELQRDLLATKPVYEGRPSVQDYPNESPTTQSSKVTKKRLYRGVSGALVAASLLALLILGIAAFNQASNPEQKQNVQVASQTQAVPTTSAATPTATATTAPVERDKVTINYPLNAASPGSVALSPDSKVMATTWKGEVKLWRTADGGLIKSIEVPDSFRETIIWALLRWSPDSQTLAVAYYYDGNTAHGTVQFWTASGEVRLELANFNEEVGQIAWSPNGEFLAIASNNSKGGNSGHNLRLWSKDGKLVRAIIQNQSVPVIRMAWSPDSNMIATASEQGAAVSAGQLQLWQTDGKRVASYNFNVGQFNDLKWSPDGKRLAVGRATDTDNVRVYNLEQIKANQPQPWLELRNHKAFVYKVAWSPDSQTLFSSAGDQTIAVWDVAKGSRLNVLNVSEPLPDTLAVSPDGNLVAVRAMEKRQVQLLDKSGKVVKTFDEQNEVLDIYWTPDGKKLVTVSEAGTLTLWKL